MAAVVAVVVNVRMKITRKTKLSEILRKHNKAVEILFESGMACIGCPMAGDETLEQGCKAHGFSDEDINDLVKKLNENSSSIDED